MQEEAAVAAPGPQEPPLASPSTMAAWRWPRYETVRPATGPLLAGTVATGVLFDLALRSETAALGLAATIWVAIAVLLGWRRTHSPWTIGCCALAAVLAGALLFRASPWLVAPDLLAIGFLLTAGVLFAGSGDPFDLRWSAFTIRLVALLPLAFWFPGWMLRPVVRLAGRVAGSRRSDVLALARGVAIAIPIALVLGVLLGSADPVFASFVDAHRFGDPGELILHLLLITIGAGLLGGAAAGMAIGFGAARAPRPASGTREALVVMAVIDALFALFAVAQGVAARGGGAAALRDAGVSYADYARSGFFQLLWVAGLSWLVIVVARRAIPAEPGTRGRVLIALIELAIALVLLIVYVAHVRLQLYEDAYGFTMLRLYSHVFAGLAAAAFVLLGASVAGVGSGRSWLFGAVAALAVAVLVGLNAVNPEVLVLRQNLDLASRTGKFDYSYAWRPSDEAVPATLAADPGTDREQRDGLRRVVCGALGHQRSDWESFSVAARQAEDARRASCPGAS